MTVSLNVLTAPMGETDLYINNLLSALVPSAFHHICSPDTSRLSG